MPKKNERFVKTYTQGVASICEIWVDKETGVKSGYGRGLTPLLDRDGKPIITPIYDQQF